jgi:hypothetical protein
MAASGGRIAWGGRFAYTAGGRGSLRRDGAIWKDFMALALLFALALSGAQPPAAPVSDQPASDQPMAAGAPTGAAADAGAPSREDLEDVIPEGAPKDDYEFVAWCHGALAGQIELDPIVEKDMDAIEGKAKAAKRKADDAEIAKEHKRYLALYEKALSAAEKASPVAIHEKGVDAELLGYKIWGPTRNKAPVWRMIDWGNWEVPPHCEKAAKRLYDRATLLGVALKTEEQPAAAPSAAKDAGGPPPTEPAAKTLGDSPNPAESNTGGDALRGPH